MGIKSWINVLRFIWYFFSITELIKTLFAPWHRDVSAFPRGFDAGKYFEIIIWNIFSRLMGAIVRLFTIALGLVAELVVMALLPLFLVLPLKIKYESLVKIGSIGKGWSYGFTPFLREHTRQLKDARETTLIGRDNEIKRIEQVLARGRQDNVLLVGEPGIGKTTLLEQLAKRISWGVAPKPLKNRRVIELIAHGLNDAEIRRALNEAARAGNIILVIEDLDKHKEVLRLLPPYLEAKELQIIATTDYEGFHTALKPWNDIVGQLEKIEIHEPSAKEAAHIVELIAQQHKIKIKPKVIQEIVYRTNQLIQNVPQPEKSIDVLEELGATKEKKEITIQDVHDLLSQKTEVPIGTLEAKEKETLLHLETILMRQVIGQDEAVRAIANAMRRSRTGVRSAKKPIGSFLFLGPTGVGKTHTAKALAECYFGSEDRVIRFDMSEFQETGSTDRLITRLTRAIEEDPFSLLFLDEIEKAHRDILNLFLQLLDDGRLTSTTGRTVSFRNTIVIATSNAGADHVRQMVQESKDLIAHKQEFINTLIKEQHFRPEFMNRFDAVILFKPLSHDDLKKIAELLLSDLNERLSHERHIKIEITPDLIEKIATLSYQPEFGARPMRRVIQDKIESKLAEMILKGEAHEGHTVHIEIDT
jgi:ATP-dependent Clp protease ATP-binding subunit ClpA